MSLSGRLKEQKKQGKPPVKPRNKGFEVREKKPGVLGLKKGKGEERGEGLWRTNQTKSRRGYGRERKTERRREKRTFSQEGARGANPKKVKK